MVMMSLGKGLAGSGSVLGQPGICGFLTSCRKNFTVRVQVI